MLISKMVLKNQGIILYFMGKVMLTINWELDFLFIGELGQQSKRWNLSVTVFLALH